MRTARFRRWEKVGDRRSWGGVVVRNSSNNANMRHKDTTFVAIIALATLTAVSLMQLNRMLMMWKIQQGKVRRNRIHSKNPSRFHHGNLAEPLKCSNGTIFQPANRDLGNWASLPSHMNTSKMLQRIQRQGVILETGPARSTGLFI